MPYRRLPNTDLARLRALKRIIEVSMMTPAHEQAFSAINLNKIRNFLPTFEPTVSQHKMALKNQATKSKRYISLTKKARLYVSHFVQVLNFAIARGELKPEVRKFYQIEIDDKNLPPLTLEADLVTWGKYVIDGEQERLRNGAGSAIYSPSIAAVRAHYDAFVEAHRHQKMLQNVTQRASEKVAEMRATADDLILKVWNEIEEKFASLPEEQGRAKCEYNGVVYFYRPRERKNLNNDRIEQEAG